MVQPVTSNLAEKESDDVSFSCLGSIKNFDCFHGNDRFENILMNSVLLS